MSQQARSHTAAAVVPALTRIPLAQARRVARLFPSFRDFVDDALFHPAWGYYSTGQVRFGEGGHYDTFPLALSPFFGRMLAQYAFRAWRRAGEPPVFEICEVGAGNGQLCLDTVLWLRARPRPQPAWRRFTAATRYRVIERSPALMARQRHQLGALRSDVRWTRADLTRRLPAGVPFASHGVVVANEVLDCLAHHKVVTTAPGVPGVVFVIPTIDDRGPAEGVPFTAVPGVSERALSHRSLAAVMGDERLRRRIAFREMVLPLGAVPGLQAFVRHHYPEFFRPRRRYPPYFACPEIAPLIAHVARLYGSAEQLWIDYGETRSFHLQAREQRRVFAGPPHSSATVYRAPGQDDVTFFVDFSVVADAAAAAGLEVTRYAGQGELAWRSGVRLGPHAGALILQQRALSWVLALASVGPEHGWRRRGLTWGPRRGSAGRVRDDVRRGLDEFIGRRPSPFKLMILRPRNESGDR